MKLSLRRRFCRLVFCVACVVPTLVVSGAIVVLYTPVYRAAQTRAWQAMLSAETGLEVQLAQLAPLGGSHTLATMVECRDPESHEWLVRMRSAEIKRTQRGWEVLLGQPQLNVRHLDRLAALLHEHLLLRMDTQRMPVQVAAESLELYDESASESVLDVGSRLDASATGSELLVKFRAASMAEDQCVRMRFVRNRQLNPPATGWELHTATAELPCSMASPWLPALRRLGAGSVFQGSIWCEQQPVGWEAELRGVFRQVDLEQLVTRQFPHKLSGSATLTLSKCQIHAGRVTDVQGNLTSPSGVVSLSLLDAAESALGLQQHARAGGVPLLPYRQLAVGFSLSAAGLVIAPAAASDVALLSDDQGPLLSCRDSVPQSPLSFVRLLVPQADLQVPATQETAALMRSLPLPELSVRPATAQRQPYSPLRFRK